MNTSEEYRDRSWSLRQNSRELRGEAEFPHCDDRILHSPESECVYCNRPEYDSLRELRQEMRLRYTNEDTPEQFHPCPAESERGRDSVNYWHGNKPLTPQAQKEEDKLWKEWSDAVLANLRR